ncbi:MAG: aconitate hydratase AcnA [Pseudomonadota bacterium]
MSSAPLIGTLSPEGVRYHDVAATVECIRPGAFALMPYSVRVLAENLVRKSSALPGCGAMLLALIERRHDVDFPFYPARVVLQDLLGTPALVDLAGMRDAVAEAGGDPRAVNPVIPTQLVVDHSLNVEVAGHVADAMPRNMAIERRKNAERFAFLAWCKQAFSNLDVLMPGSGILHQINIERMSPVVQVQDGIAFPDTLVGTDSHTTMIDALGVLGWGVGGLEAESVMLGRASWMRLPQIVQVRLEGTVLPGVLATDVVLGLTEFLRAQQVVGSILEFHGPGVAGLPLADRATIANMAPEFGATAAMFAIDGRTLDYLRLTGRAEAQVELVAAYARAQGLWADAFAGAEFDRTLHFDLSTVELALAGPSDPHQRQPLARLKELGIAHAHPGVPDTGPMPEGAVVIAAITSCTNTSNPRSLIAAGLLARNAVARGLVRKPWVKTSLAPGSQAVEKYLAEGGLLEPLQQLGFGIIGFGCTSCNGMSGPLDLAIEQDILARQLHTTAVLSGNRNFDGRVHPRVKEAFLASPALVVAYAIAGSIRVDVAHDPLARDANGQDVRLADLWPTDAEIDQVLHASVKASQFTAVYDPMFARVAPAREGAGAGVETPVLYAWQEDSTYIRRPPYWQDRFTTLGTFQGMRALAVLGDNITTDHLSPSGAILPDSAAGEFLVAHGVQPADFNSYGTRRGDHVVAIRATFASNRLKNEMVGVEGSLARVEPEGRVVRLFEAAQTYMERGQPLIIVAGKNYGSGSSRDWAAKGVRLIGVQAVVCENFERIHRTNLVGMGMLPLEFEAGTTRTTLRIDGTETFDIAGWDGVPPPGARLTLRIHRRDGSVQDTPVVCRIDTEEERQVFAAGGLLPRMRQEFLQAA